MATLATFELQLSDTPGDQCDSARQHSPPGVVDDEGGLHLPVAHASHSAPPQLLQQHHDGRDQLGARSLQPVQGLGTPGAQADRSRAVIMVLQTLWTRQL